jgi:hypothetical protein
MARYRTYGYTPINPEKFKNGTDELIVKSSWELEFAKSCDLFPSVLGWSYETTKIPYRDPLSGRQKVYIPDFFVEVAQSDGYSQHFVFEIKPMHEQLDEYARNSKDAALIARNRAKWMAATMWADRHSAEFVVLNEKDIFSFAANKKPRTNPIKQFKQTHSTKPSTGNAIKTPSKAATKAPSNRRAIKTRTGGKTMSNRIGKVSRAKRVGKAGRS